MAPTSQLLVRIVVAKIKNKARLAAIFKRTPLRPDSPGWNCVEWAKEAYEAARSDRSALGTSVQTWAAVRNAAMWYIEQKRGAGRFDAHFNTERVPTWDSFEEKEIVA